MGILRALVPSVVMLLVLLAACGGDPATPPAPTHADLKIRFVNAGTETIRSVDVRCSIEEPDTDLRQESRNWQPVEPAAVLTLVDGDTLQVGTVVQTWFSVLAQWSEGEPYERWRVWTTGAHTVRSPGEVLHACRWPQDRWILTEVPWPPGSARPFATDDPRPSRR